MSNRDLFKKIGKMYTEDLEKLEAEFLKRTYDEGISDEARQIFWNLKKHMDYENDIKGFYETMMNIYLNCGLRGGYSGFVYNGDVIQFFKDNEEYFYNYIYNYVEDTGISVFEALGLENVGNDFLLHALLKGDVDDILLDICYMFTQHIIDDNMERFVEMLEEYEE